MCLYFHDFSVHINESECPDEAPCVGFMHISLSVCGHTNVFLIYMCYFNIVSFRTAVQHFSQNLSRASLSLPLFIPYFKLNKRLTPFSRHPPLFNYYSYLTQVFILRFKLNFIRLNYLPNSLVLGDGLNFSAGVLDSVDMC